MPDDKFSKIFLTEDNLQYVSEIRVLQTKLKYAAK